MLAGVSIKNFRGIREIPNLALSDFHVLVGPNGSGKSSFLDAIDFVRDCLLLGPLGAFEKRNVGSFEDLTWMRRGGVIEIALHFDLGETLPERAGRDIAYALSIRWDAFHGVVVDGEKLIVLHAHEDNPGAVVTEQALLHIEGTRHIYGSESGLPSDVVEFEFGRDKLALGLLPPDETRYRTATAVRRFLTKGVRYLQLDSIAMRQPCPTSRSADLDLDGTNIARAVGNMVRPRGLGAIFAGDVAIAANGRVLTRIGDLGASPYWFAGESPIALWADHLRYALPDLDAIGWARRQADNAEYLLIRYKNGLEVPSWLLSDGTLRMMALTLPAFLPPKPAIYMVEEPENSVHPQALEIVLQSLSSIPGAQTLVATHSPLVVQHCGIGPLLCFSRDDQGVHIVRGPDHPALKDWDGRPDLDTIFGAGLLG